MCFLKWNKNNKKTFLLEPNVKVGCAICDDFVLFGNFNKVGRPCGHLASWVWSHSDAAGADPTPKTSIPAPAYDLRSNST